MKGSETREPGVVYLHAFGRWKHDNSRLPDISPFVVKLETFLRIAGVPYRSVLGLTASGAGVSGKNKIPWIELNGEVVDDSQLAVESITKSFGLTLDDHLPPSRKAALHCARKMMEEALYWGIIKHRYTQVGFRHIYLAMASCVPAYAAWVASIWGRISIGVVQLWGQGYGRHTAQQVYDFDRADIDALAELLGTEDPFFGGTQACSFDAVAFGFLSGITELEWGGPDQLVVKNHQNLMLFMQRMKSAFWADWDSPTARPPHDQARILP